MGNDCCAERDGKDKKHLVPIQPLDLSERAEAPGSRSGGPKSRSIAAMTPAERGVREKRRRHLESVERSSYQWHGRRMEYDLTHFDVELCLEFKDEMLVKYSTLEHAFEELTSKDRTLTHKRLGNACKRIDGQWLAIHWPHLFYLLDESQSDSVSQEEFIERLLFICDMDITDVVSPDAPSVVLR
eukprot:gnl/TRDRNA2_/TRDRNA2_192087_c0_seq1.p1 gnl/TRDRNA2_/TRDRNA2_192087_c0~~gnl/TRDRNA2_/TRDRNA2_192087_c0_seq1.p1  ORF type:complete len:201 (+),score=31.23 gnl/TRDRNA2_/TRDRNA2_192087_c0_seq1:51-605(+)